MMSDSKGCRDMDGSPSWVLLIPCRSRRSWSRSSGPEESSSEQGTSAGLLPIWPEVLDGGVDGGLDNPGPTHRGHHAGDVAICGLCGPNGHQITYPVRDASPRGRAAVERKEYSPRPLLHDAAGSGLPPGAQSRPIRPSRLLGAQEQTLAPRVQGRYIGFTSCPHHKRIFEFPTVRQQT
jgi:hypothetical protein